MRLRSCSSMGAHHPAGEAAGVVQAKARRSRSDQVRGKRTFREILSTWNIEYVRPDKGAPGAVSITIAASCELSIAGCPSVMLTNAAGATHSKSLMMALLLS